MKAVGAAAGYRLVRWTNAAPAEFLDDLGYLDSRPNADAPTGDLAWEAEKVDAARVRAAEEAMRVRRRTAFHTGAVHEDSGRLIAWTMIAGPDGTPGTHGRERPHAPDQPDDGVSGGGPVDSVADDRLNRRSPGRNGAARYPPRSRPACRSNAFRAPYVPVSAHE